MAEAATETRAPTLSEQYLLKDKEEKTDAVSKPVEEKEQVKTETVLSEEKAAESPSVDAEKKSDDTSDAVASEEKTEDTPTENSSGDAPVEDAESNENTEDQTAEEEETADEKPEIKLETAPADFRFPTTNQTRHCFTRYIEYHRCIAAKGEGAQECEKFANYYRSLCPSEWVERWNEQRENGTFPGPL